MVWTRWADLRLRPLGSSSFRIQVWSLVVLLPLPSHDNNERRRRLLFCYSLGTGK